MQRYFIERPLWLDYRTGVAMQSAYYAQSTLPDDYQITVPKVVRQTLGLAKWDSIHYAVLPSDEVVLSRVPANTGQASMQGKLLEHLARDIAKHPESLQRLPSSLMNDFQALTAQVEVDLYGPLAEEDE